MNRAHSRGTWGSRSGFILAAAGSAVGLGNIWGFPTQVGQGGGGAFVLVYLFCVLLICAPIMVAEIALGRHSRLSPAGAFRSLAPDSSWWIVGALGVATGAGILSFYSVIAGWTVAYVWFTATSAVSGTAESINEFFITFTSNGFLSLTLTCMVLGTTAAILLGGVRAGIERATKGLMPALILLLIILAVRATTLPGAEIGLSYYMQPDLSRLLDITVFNAALGQAFFSLSLGMGAMITYGSYLGRREAIGASTVWIVILDTSVALLAGFIIFPAGFSIEGFDPTSSGPGLIFTVLPRLFSTLPGGNLFGAAFFLLLSLAALTSTISLLEVPVSHCVDTRGWSRRKAVAIVTTCVFLLAIPSSLGNGAVGIFSDLPVVGGDFLGLMATIWNNFSLPIGGLLTAIFVGRVWRIDQALAELRAEHASFPAASFWVFLVKWVCPVAIGSIIIATALAML
ncbi:MAG: sodium-dependent transporter [Acidobacteriota bacterium]|nr:sodium-dependent transporter [Acidobacteriota bacterium]